MTTTFVLACVKGHRTSPVEELEGKSLVGVGCSIGRGELVTNPCMKPLFVVEVQVDGKPVARR